MVGGGRGEAGGGWEVVGEVRRIADGRRRER